MKTLVGTLIISVVTFALASQADAAKAKKQKKSEATAHSTVYRPASTARGTTYQGGVLVGPL